MSEAREKRNREQQKWLKFATLYFFICIIVTWALAGTVFNSVTPFILGLPIILFWTSWLMALVGFFGAMFIAYKVTKLDQEQLLSGEEDWR